MDAAEEVNADAVTNKTPLRHFDTSSTFVTPLSARDTPNTATETEPSTPKTPTSSSAQQLLHYGQAHKGAAIVVASPSPSARVHSSAVSTVHSSGLDATPSAKAPSKLGSGVSSHDSGVAPSLMDSPEAAAGTSSESTTVVRSAPAATAAASSSSTSRLSYSSTSPPLTTITSLADMAALFERHRARVYARGRLWKKDDCAVDGARATNRGWVLHRAELRGYALSLTPDTVVEKGTRATSYINVADAHVDWAGELADAGVFALSSAGRNRYLLQPCGDGDDDAQHPPPSSPLTPSNINARDDLLCNWVTALRLSAFEHALLGQVYTEALYNWRVELKRAEMDMLYPIVDRKGVRKAVKEVSVEGWLQARIAGSLEWKQFYCVVRRRSIENDQPPTTQPSSRWSRGTKALKISQHTSQHTSSHVGTLMLFATRKDAEKAAAGKWKDTGKIATLLAYEMLDVEEAFAVFPEKVELVDLATIFKVDGGRIVAGGKASTLVNTLASARSLASGNTTTSGSTAVSGITAVTGPPASAATINAVPTTSSHLLLMAKTQLEMARFLSGIWSAFGLNGKAPELYPSTIAAALTTQKSTASPSSTLIPPGTRAEAIFQRVAPAAVPELFLDPLAIASAVNVRGWTSEETRLHFWSLLREQQRLQQTAAAQLKVVVPGSAAGMDSPTKGAEGVVDTPTVNTRLVLQMCDVAVSTPKRKRTEVEVFVPALKKGPSSSKSESISSESTSDEEEDDDDDESLMEKHQGSPKRLAIASSIPAAMQTRSSQRRDSIASDSNSWMDVEDEESDKKPPPVPAKHTSIAGTRYRSIAPRPSSLGSTDNNDDCDSIDQSKIVKRQPAPIVPKLATGATNLASTVTNSKTVTGYKSYRRNHFIQAIRTAEQQALSEERRQLAEQKASLEDERRRLEQDRMEMASAVGFGQPAPSVVYSQYGYGGVPQAANNMPYGAYPQHVMMNPALGGMPPHLYYQQPGTIFPAPQILGYHGAPVAGNVSTGDYGPDPSDSVSAVMEREDHAVPMSVVGAMPMSVVGAMPMTMVGAMPAQQPEAEEPLTHGLVGMIAGEKRSRSTAYDPRLGTYRAKGEDAGPKHAGARPFVPPQQMTAYPPAPSMAAGGYGMFQPQMGGSVVGGNGGYAASAVGSTVYYAPQMMFGASMAPQQQRGSVVGMPYGYPPMMMAAQQQQPYVPPAPSSMAFANQQQFRQSGVFPVNTIPEGEEEE